MNAKLKKITIIVFTMEVIAAIGLFILIRTVARNHQKYCTKSCKNQCFCRYGNGSPRKASKL